MLRFALCYQHLPSFVKSFQICNKPLLDDHAKKLTTALVCHTKIPQAQFTKHLHGILQRRLRAQRQRRPVHESRQVQGAGRPSSKGCVLFLVAPVLDSVTEKPDFDISAEGHPEFSDSELQLCL